ncbi:hotdog fold thioesterase [Cerasibacillus terrae]|uniref:Hotdog fold thioesterase n=1 Tax=Cerasibacillus terrae TaxID=2498845 RepID=A0A5C8NGD1_9BACI|nr:hotdog fold thioesterase [Cerasibacillus terrae]
MIEKGRYEVEYDKLLRQLNLDESLLGTLGIEFEQFTPDCVICTMPVDTRTVQPFGLLHGGASVALAETAASFGTAINIDLSTHVPVGLEINANHIRGKREGIVKAVATPLHKGRTTMVWDIRLTDEEERLICISRCTVAIIKKR